MKFESARKVARRVTREIRMENAGPKISRALTFVTFISGAALTLARLADWNRTAGLTLPGRRAPIGKLARTAFDAMTPRSALGMGAAGALTYFAQRSARAESRGRWIPLLVGALATWEAVEGARGAFTAKGRRERKAGFIGGTAIAASALALPGAWWGVARALSPADRRR